MGTLSVQHNKYKFYIGTRIFLKRGSSWHANKGKKASKTATTTAVEGLHIGAPAIEGLSCAWLFLWIINAKSHLSFFFLRKIIERKVSDKDPAFLEVRVKQSLLRLSENFLV